MKPKIGMRVSVFNRVGENYKGEIVALNKRTAVVKADKYSALFTIHRDAGGKYNDFGYYLVPYGDLTLIQPQSSPEQSTKS